MHSEYFSEISIILKLILVLPATNAQSERVFSLLGIVKPRLRNYTKQARLNHLMILKFHKKELEKLSLAEVANEFAARNERRKTDFGINKFV